MTPQSKPKLSRTVLLAVSLSAAISLALLGGYFILTAYLDFEAESDQMREAHVLDQKRLLRDEVNRTVEYIGFMKSQIENRTRELIKNRVEEAHRVAEHLYRKYRSQATDDQLQAMIREALRPIRFKNGRGYYFATNLDGVEELFADKPELEGQNLIGMTGGQGRMVIRDMIEIAKTKGQGFYRYHWSKPGATGKQHQKLAYIKLFKPFNWFFGTGEYLADMEADIQQEVASRIEKIRFQGDNYFFIARWDGFTLVGPGKGKNNLEATDVNGVKVVRELIKLAQGEGGYLHYVVPAFTGLKTSSKISYVRGIHDWQWYVGAGEYIDEIDAVIDQRRAEFKRQLTIKIAIMTGVILAMLGLSFLLAHRTARRAKRDLDEFEAFYGDVSNLERSIDIDRIRFEEFGTLAKATNRMVEELRWSEQRLMLVLDNLDADVYVSRLESHEVLFANLHMRNSFGSGLEGRICHHVFRGLIDGPCPHCNKGRLLDIHGRPRGTIVWDDHNPITKRWYHNQDQAIKWTDGTMVHLHIATDITEAHQAEEDKAKLEASLRQAVKMEAMGTLAGGIAHDFNNILASIMGYAELALEDSRLNRPNDAKIREVIKAGQRAKELITQILAFSRKLEPNMKPVNLNRAVEQTKSMLARIIPRMVEIEHRLAEDLWLINADINQMTQVLMNLGSNANDAMPDGGRLIIETANVTLGPDYPDHHAGASPGDHVLLTVSDTGLGMDRETLDQVFDPFFTKKEVGRGTGLGLATVYGIVKSHRGYIMAYSEVGQGTTFKVYFPAIQAVEEEVHPDREEASEPPGGDETILVVDDEESIRDIGLQVLTRQGYRVLLAATGEEALRIYSERAFEIDLIILDISMPGMGGHRSCQEILEIDPQAKVLIASGYSRNGQLKDTLNSGAVGFVPKPFSRIELLTTIRKVLDS